MQKQTVALFHSQPLCSLLMPQWRDEFSLPSKEKKKSVTYPSKCKSSYETLAPLNPPTPKPSTQSPPTPWPLRAIATKGGSYFLEKKKKREIGEGKGK